jgi:DNA-binding Lrp family transcriptional regulator
MFGEFDDIHMYLMELQGEPYFAILPLQQAADVLGVTRAAISQRIKAKKLDGVKLGRTTYACALSVLAVIDQEHEDVRTIREFLEQVARSGKTTNYSEVMPLVGLSSKVPYERLIIGKLLGLVSRESNESSKSILLSALVFNQSLRRPSDAFFGLAYDEGYEDAYDDDFLDKHLRKIYRKYRSK